AGAGADSTTAGGATGASRTTARAGAGVFRTGAVGIGADSTTAAGATGVSRTTARAGAGVSRTGSVGIDADSTTAAGATGASRTTHETKPSRRVSPPLDTAHQAISSPNSTSPIVNSSLRCSVAFTTLDADIAVYTGSVSLATTARAPAATVVCPRAAAIASSASSAIARPRQTPEILINYRLPGIIPHKRECLEMFQRQ